jgi:long-chain acyl-CoA synthetase
VRPGERVLVVAPSVPEFAGAYYGILAAGAIAVTANTMSTRRELEYLGSDAEVAVVMGWSEIRPAPEEAASTLGVAYWPIVDELADFMETSAGELHPSADDDTAVILYTSGTTGHPKGAQLTHANLAASASIFTEVLEVDPDDRFGTALPLFHVFGQAVVMGTALRNGASLSLLPRFDAEELLDPVRRDKVTVLLGVPTMWNALLHSGDGTATEDFASLRLAGSGGAALPTEMLRAFEERFGCVILEGYGLSETTGAATFNGLRRARKPACTGIAAHLRGRGARRRRRARRHRRGG